MTSNIQEFINSLPPASENNARTIVKSKISAFHNSKSTWRAREVTRVTHGELEADFENEDLGNDPKKNYKHSIPVELRYDTNIY